MRATPYPSRGCTYSSLKSKPVFLIIFESLRFLVAGGSWSFFSKRWRMSTIYQYCAGSLSTSRTETISRITLARFYFYFCLRRLRSVGVANERSERFVGRWSIKNNTFRSAMREATIIVPLVRRSLNSSDTYVSPDFLFVRYLSEWSCSGTGSAKNTRRSFNDIVT